MILQELKNIKETKKDLKKFGLTIGSVLVVITLLLYYFDKPSYTIYAAAAVLFILSGLLVPVILKPLNRIWMGFSVILGFFTSRIILTILFYFIITPIAIIFKIIGKDPLNLKFNKKADSYWIKRKQAVDVKTDFERQF